jgi:hypothetical protein
VELVNLTGIRIFPLRACIAKDNPDASQRFRRNAGT